MRLLLPSVGDRTPADRPELELRHCRDTRIAPRKRRDRRRRTRCSGQPRPVGDDVRHIGLCLSDPRNQTSANPPWPGIVSGKRKVDLPEVIELLPEVTGAAPHVLQGIVPIDAEPARCSRHQLCEAVGIRCRRSDWIISALANYHRIEEAGWDAMLARNGTHHSIVGRAASLSCACEKAGRPIRLRRTPRGEGHRLSHSGTAT